MEAEYNGRQVERQEAVQEVASRVVVCRDERIRCADAVVPALVELGESIAIGVVQYASVDVVLEDLGDR